MRVTTGPTGCRNHPDMPLQAGQTFAGYTVVRRLGAGKGEVYLVQHPRLPGNDPLKLLGSNVSADPTFRERFLREADLACKLWHPHIDDVSGLTATNMTLGTMAYVARPSS